MEPAVLIMLFLTIKHFIADFLYQPPYQWMNKGTYGHLGGIVHAGQHIVLTALLYFLVPMSMQLLVSILIFEFLVHYHVDWAKMKLNATMGWGPLTHVQYWVLLGIDQLLHGLTYVVILAVLI